MSKERGAEITEDEKQTKTINVIVCRSLIDFFILFFIKPQRAFRFTFLKLIINMMLKKGVLGGVDNFERY
jgi:hypothetical protein